MTDLSKTYNPKEVEDKVYRLWEKSGFFNPDPPQKFVGGRPHKTRRTFTIVLPPPNITGSLHMGHALNAVIQDVLIRWKRMQGYRTLWLPGTDHAGIAAQNVVEKELKKEGLTRFDLGREKFLRRMWQWKEKYGNIILEQLKKLGASCDWSRTRFTMDKDYSLAVRTAFLHYYKKGWIYRDKRVVNWCTRCRTSLSDLELEYKQETGKLWYIKYPILEKFKIRNAKPEHSFFKKNECSAEHSNKFECSGPKSEINPKSKILNSKFLVVATTRPETMLGDTAVAVNPKDTRYKNLIGKKVMLPLAKREIPIIADKAVDPNFGTGAVKVTPAHDVTDYEIGLRHQLPSIKVIDERGKITKDAPILYQGLSVEEARSKVVQDLQKLGLLEKVEEYSYQIPKCYRCNTTIELLPSVQWFLKMDALARLAIKAVKSGRVRFIPRRWEKVYFDWLKNVKDWCISRQLWWGHTIPLKGESDVLDTWFSSALWPFATLGWPKKAQSTKHKAQSDLIRFYPTDVLSTDRGIINLWVARMIFSGMEFMKKEPFCDVYVHATVLTKEGQRMSKSLGTGVDPVNLIEKYGADATRFGIAWQITELQDIRFSEENIVMGKKFCNKIWNAARFILLQIPNSKIQIPNKLQIPKSTSTAADRRILKALHGAIRATNKDLKNYRFGHAAQRLYHFFWHEFCDVYIEMSKLQMTNYKLQKQTQQILLYVLLTSLKLLHPFMPFITEEIYQQLPLRSKKKCLMVEEWPNARWRELN